MKSIRRFGRRPRLPRAKATAFAALLAIAVVGAGCGGSNDDGTDANAAGTTGTVAGETTELRVAFVQGFGTLPLQIAQTQGIFERHGLEVELAPGLNIQVFAPALGRQYDVIMSTPVDFLTAASQGIDVKAFSGMQETTRQVPTAPVMTKDPAIKAVEDLVGKSVGVVSLAGTNYLSMVYLLQEAGIDPETVDFVATPFPAMLDQLNAGRLDAAVSTIPFSTGMEAAGYGMVFDEILEATGEDADVQAFFSTSSSFEDENPEALTEFRAALDEAIEWIDQNEGGARSELETWLKLPPEVAQNAPLPAFNTDISPAKIEPFIPIVEQAGGIDNVPPAESLVVATE